MPAPSPDAPHARPSTPPPPAHGMDLKRIYHVLMERLWLVATCLVVATLLTLGYIQRQPTLFQANAVVQIDQEDVRMVKVEKFQQEDLRWLDALRTIEQTLKSRTVLERVVDSLKLTQNPAFIGMMAEPTKEELAAVLDRIVSVRLRKVTHPNPDLTAKIANAVVAEYIAHSYEQNATVSEDAASFLSKEGRRLKLKLEESEGALQSFRDVSKTVSLEERNDIITARLKELNARLTEANSTSIRYQAELAPCSCCRW
jgi:polysaccharide biosynthesis transport protein